MIPQLLIRQEMSSSSDDWNPSQELRKSTAKRTHHEVLPLSQGTSRLRLKLSNRNSSTLTGNTSQLSTTVIQKIDDTLNDSEETDDLGKVSLETSSSSEPSPKRPRSAQQEPILEIKRKSDHVSKLTQIKESTVENSCSPDESEFTFTFDAHEFSLEEISEPPQNPNNNNEDKIRVGENVACVNPTDEITTVDIENEVIPVNLLLNKEKRDSINLWLDNLESPSSFESASVISSSSSTIRPPQSASKARILDENSTQPLVLSGMVTPSKKAISSTSKSPGSRQTTITAFFSARGTPEKESSVSVAAEPGIEVEEVSGPLTVVKEHAKKAWSSLMSRMRGTAATLQASLQVSETSTETETVSRRACPFYKRIPQTNFVVDAFSYGRIPGVTGYFLTHFHYDHYGGLGSWIDKPLYCSQTTANLVKLKMKVKPALIKTLPLNESRVIENVEVVVLDANHCPGAVMFIFRLLSGKTFLHVGDFRAHPNMETWRELKFSPIDQLFLDTTYCAPQWSFPSQDEVISCVKTLVREKFNILGRRLLVICGSYTIGKEKVFRAAAEELRCKVWAPTEKRRVLDCLEDQALSKMIVADPRLAQVHVVNMGDLAVSNLQRYLTELEPEFTHILALKPTGWEYDSSVSTKGLEKMPVQSYGRVQVCGIPYSEHSSYEELRRFVKYFRPKQIVPTVNVGSEKERKRMQEIFDRWMKETTSSYADDRRSHRDNEADFIDRMKSPSKGRRGKPVKRKMQFAW